MHKSRLLFCAAIITAALSLHASAADHKMKKADNPNGPLAPRLTGLGTHTHPVTTKSKDAQAFFDQGMRLVFGFNHAEAVRAFREAARLDPDCAMAYWGHALALGPNINAPVTNDAEKEAVEVLQRAIALKPKVSEQEQDYIDALATRYSADENRDRVKLDAAFADALRKLSQKYPDDLDAATLCAEALMDSHPWDYWLKDGSAQPWTGEIVQLLESVIERNPNHPGALHYYIHAVEASPNPGKAEAAADRLAKLMPAAGHLVHMPAHIYIRVGRYADAATVNVEAIAADEDYITQCRVQGLYPLLYHPHNIHFLWFAATMQGRSKTALETAEKVSTNAKKHEDMLRMPEGGGVQNFMTVHWLALTRFGKWDEVLAIPEQPADLPYLNAMRAYVRGVAFTAKGQTDEATAERDKLVKLAADPALTTLIVDGINIASDVTAVALAVLEGKLAAKKGDVGAAVDHLSRGVRLEDGLNYMEPPAWDAPVRQTLGAVLLDGGRPAEAETVYWEDLRRNPENPWSLFGLAKSLEQQQQIDQAQRIQERFKKAWTDADFELKASYVQ